MIVDYLTFTFAEERENKLPGLVKRIDPGAVSLESKSGYAGGTGACGAADV